MATSCLVGQAPGLALNEFEQIWPQVQREGSEALDANKFWIAEPLLKEAVTEAESFGAGDLRLAKSLGELGRLYTIRGRFADAEPYLERELAVREQALGRHNGEIIPPMGALIAFYLTYGTASKAEPLTEELLALVEGKLREPASQRQGSVKLEKGTPLQAWAGTVAVGAGDPLIEWAITCDAIGNLYRSRENFDLAERLYKAALDLKASVLPKEHLSLANSYDSLGSLCLTRNEYGEAESYFRDALAITERTLQPENPQVYARLDKLAKCLIKAGKPKQAEELYVRAQSLWKSESSRNFNEARALFALGSLYVDQKNYAAAAPLLQQALQLAESINGPWSISLIPYLEKYAYTLYYLGRKPEWESLRARANTISGVTQQ
jgi:tetratricopeptide (TPR) repeat protein